MDKCTIIGCGRRADSYNKTECRKHAHILCEVDGCYRPTCAIHHKCDVHTYIRHILLCSIQGCLNRCAPILNVCEYHWDESAMADRDNFEELTDIVLPCSKHGGSFNICPTYHYTCEYHQICQYVPKVCLNITKDDIYCHQHRCANKYCYRSDTCVEHVHQNMIKLYGTDCYLSITPQDIMVLIESYI